MSVSNEVIKILDDISQRIGVAIDWSSDNIIPQIMEMMDGIVEYHIVGSIFGIIVGITLTIPFIFCIKTIIKAVTSKKSNWIIDLYSDGSIDEPTIFGYISLGVSSIFIIISMFFVIGSAYDLLFWIFAPEYRLLQILLQYV